MPEYRIFQIGTNGRASGPSTAVECTGDAAAVDLAMQLLNGLDLEVWNQQRFVARLPSSTSKA